MKISLEEAIKILGIKSYKNDICEYYRLPGVDNLYTGREGIIRFISKVFEEFLNK